MKDLLTNHSLYNQAFVAFSDGHRYNFVLVVIFVRAFSTYLNDVVPFGLYSTSRGFIAASFSPDIEEVFLNWRSTLTTHSANHIFGIQDLRNDTFRFVVADSNGYLRLSSALNMLSENVFVWNDNDNRIFAYTCMTQSDKCVLRHVASGKYLSITANNQIILAQDPKAALEVQIIIYML